MESALTGPLALVLGADPVVDLQDILVPVAIASPLVAALFLPRLPQKVRRFLSGVVAVLFLYPIVVVTFPFAPRTSVVCFSFVAFPLLLIAYAAAWRRTLVSLLAVAGIVGLAASPMDVALSVGAERKGLLVVPTRYGTGGGFNGSSYSLGCLVDPPSVYMPRFVLVFSL